MELYRRRLGWTDGLSALIFHGQRADIAEVFNLTSLFQVTGLYTGTSFAQAKLMLGYMIGGFTGDLAQYSEGHYLLTQKGGQRQLAELRRRGLRPQEAWVLDPADPRKRP